jgi:hypothetical protein
VVLVGFFGADDKASNETYTKVASQLRDSYLFGASNDAELAEKEGVKQPAIVLYKTFDEGKNKFTKKFDVDAIEKFAKAAATPLIGEVGPETYQNYMSVSLHPILTPQADVTGRSSSGLHLRRDSGGALHPLQGAQDHCQEVPFQDQLCHH